MVAERACHGHELCEANKALVRRFYDEVFATGDASRIDEFMRDDYRQHSPGIADGKAGFLEFFAKFSELEPRFEMSILAADGDYVFAFFKCVVAGGGVNKVVDIYRVEDGLLAEHWDVVNHDVGSLTSAHGLF